MSTQGKIKTKDTQYVTMLIGAILIVLAFAAPGIGSMTKEMIRTICLIVFGILFWVKRPIPILATSLLVVVLQPLAKLAALNAAFAGFTSPAHYFVIASFAIALALQKTTLCSNLIKSLLSLAKGKIRVITLMFMLMTFIVSMFISDIAAVLITLAFVLDFATLINDETEKRRVLKLLMVAVPFASILGGASTTVGSTVNVLALNLMKQHSGLEVTFIQWFAVSFPVTIVSLFACWGLFVKIHKADNIQIDLVQQYVSKLEINAKESKTRKEPIILAVLAVIVLAWIFSSWISILDSTIVAIIGMALLFLPGVSAYTWEEFKQNMSWEIPIMGAATISLGNLAINHGIIEQIIGYTTRTFSGVGLAGIIGILGLLVTILLVAVPVGPAMVSMLAIPAYIMAETLGFNPVIAVVVVGIFASNSTILPLNSTYLVSYTKGHWKIKDLLPVGIVVSIVWIALAALWMPIASRLVF